MSIDTSITAEAMAELQLAVDRAVKGVRDPEAMRKAILGLNKSREELRAKGGTLDVAVDLIRESRDE